MKTIIAGGRDYHLTPNDLRFLNSMRGEITEVVHGDQTGADTGGKLWAQAWGITVKPFPAKWKIYGNAAGPIRNREMAEYARGGRCILFPGGHGTESMHREAKRAGLAMIDLRVKVGAPIWCAACGKWGDHGSGTCPTITHPRV